MDPLLVPYFVGAGLSAFVVGACALAFPALTMFILGMAGIFIGVLVMSGLPAFAASSAPAIVAGGVFLCCLGGMTKTLRDGKRRD